jgi:hypothetical protein
MIKEPIQSKNLNYYVKSSRYDLYYYLTYPSSENHLNLKLA